MDKDSLIVILRRAIIQITIIFISLMTLLFLLLADIPIDSAIKNQLLSIATGIFTGAVLSLIYVAIEKRHEYNLIKLADERLDKHFSDLSKQVLGLKPETDSERVYENFEEAVHDLMEDFKNSTEVKCFSTRGDVLVTLMDKITLRPYVKQKINIEAMMLNSDAPAIEKRVLAREGAKESLTLSEYRELVVSNADIILARRTLLQKGNHEISLTLRRHNQPVVFCFVLLNDAIYYGFHCKDIDGKKLRFHRANSATAIYKGFAHYFSVIWDWE